MKKKPKKNPKKGPRRAHLTTEKKETPTPKTKKKECSLSAFPPLRTKMTKTCGKNKRTHTHTHGHTNVISRLVTSLFLGDNDQKMSPRPQ